MPQYKYAMYNPGQYPADVQAQMDAMSADGWHIHTALPNYTELYVVWEKDGSALVSRLAQHLSGELEPPASGQAVHVPSEFAQETENLTAQRLGLDHPEV